MKRPARVIIALDTALETQRANLRGVMKYMKKHVKWDCHFTLVGSAIREAIGRAASAEGIIIDGRYATEKLLRMKIQAVAVGVLAPTNFPRVGTDYNALVRLAVDHLVERGFRRFGHYGIFGFQFSSTANMVFRRAVEELGYKCDTFKCHGNVKPDAWWPTQKHLLNWVKGLTKPVGIFCYGDPAARELRLACQKAGVRVPQEVGILGLGNDEMRCCMCSPELSSIDSGADKVGFEAAKLLHRMLDGNRMTAEEVLVPPERVVLRESTEVIAVEDPHVSTAVHYIYEHLAEGVSVKQMARDLDVSRRCLGIAFRKHLGRTVHEVIVRSRLQRVSGLLESGNKSLAQISQICGLNNRSRLSRFFKQHIGMTPLAYRKAYQRKYI